MIYKLSLPIIISYVIDDNDLQVEDIEDLAILQEKHDVDLQDIIDEYEYKLEAEENYLQEEEDSFGINRTEILQSVINDNLSDIVERINKEYKLSSLNNVSVKKIFNTVQADFNNHKFLDDHTNDFQVNSVLIKEYDTLNSSFLIDVDLEGHIMDLELSELRNVLDVKCTEEWGSKFEENDISDVIEEDSMYVYVKCWDNDNPIKFIN